MAIVARLIEFISQQKFTMPGQPQGLEARQRLAHKREK